MVLPPGHQELTRRATPTTIMPVEVPIPPADSFAPPFDGAAAAAMIVSEPAPSGVYPDGMLRTGFDAIQRRLGGTFGEFEGWEWISDFGDPIAEHHAVREAVGVWDESPLRKWFFKGKDALAAADHVFTSDMAALAVGQCRYGPFCDRNGKMLGDGVVYRGEDDESVFVVTALESDADHFRQACSHLDLEIEERTFEIPHLQLQGPRSRELLSRLTDADVEGLKYFRWFPEPIKVGGVDGCYVSRTGYSGEIGYEIFVPARGRRAGVAGGARPGRRRWHPAVRSGSGGVASDRGRTDLPRLRLLPGGDLAVPRESRSHDQAREARLRR